MIYEEGSRLSNLERFLLGTTPIIHSQRLPKSESESQNPLWHPPEIDTVEYFTLSDLWNSYDEWSAYGAGVPISLDAQETLIQYYVPFLSALQIFTTSSHLQCLREEMDSRGSFCDVYNESDTSSSEGAMWEFDPDTSRLGCLYFQHIENSAPNGRVPLMTKVCSLAESYPGLMSLRSVDLSPASWMAVAWYPIYHIPVGRTVKELTTCFLTFHTLSSSFQDIEMSDHVDKKEKQEGIALSPFALATYKMQGSLWQSGNSGLDEELLASLSSIADSWLKQLHVKHHDFDYFTGIRRP